MLLDDVYLISDKLDLATEAQVEAAEADLKARFPNGYLDYVTTLGTGTLNGQIRVLPPTEIVEKTKEYRTIEAEGAADAEKSGFSVWESIEVGLDLLPPDRWLTAVLLIDTSDGHRIVYHPDAPDDLIFIPHEEMEVYRAGGTLNEAIAWLLDSGPWGTSVHTSVLMSDGHFIERPVRYFEPDSDREHISFNLQGTGAFAQVRAHLVDLALQQPDNTLFVSETFTDEDGTKGEVLHFFVQEYSGAIWCNDSPIIQISYDRARHTPSLDQLVDFCRTYANPFWV